MKAIRLLFPILNPLRSSLCLTTLFSLALTWPAAGTSLQLSFTEPNSVNESNRQPVIEWNAEPSKTYLVQSATDLSPETVWKTEEAVRATGVGPIKWAAPEVLRTEKYYQLVLPQPDVFSVEPALVNSGDSGALLYLYGQCLPTNGSVIINGQNFIITSFDPNGSWVALSLNGLPPGTPITGSIVVLDQASNVVSTLPLQNPVVYGTELTAEQLQGPPEEPPASPTAAIVKEISFAMIKHPSLVGAQGLKPNKDYATDPYVEGFAGKKGYDYYQAQGDMKTAGAHNNPAFQDNKNEGTMPLGINSQGNRGAVIQFDVVNARALVSSAGELQVEEADMMVRGRGMDFGWVRNYRSRSGLPTAQGAGWDFSYNVSLSQQPDGTVVLRPGNGRADTFYPDGTNGWTRDEYFVEIRDLNADGMPDVLFADTGKWLFKPSGLPEAGKLWQIIDRNGNTITLHYNGAGQLTSIVDTLDRTNTVAYTSAGQIESVTDFSGRSVRYEYDTQGDLVACISPAVVGTPTGNDFPNGKTNRFTYTRGNLDNRLNHNLVSIIDPKGQTALQIAYDPTNNPASLDFDAVISLLRGIDKKDIRRGLVVPRPSNSFATVQTIVNDYVGNVTECLFDSRQRCVSMREFTGRANRKLPTTATDNRPAKKLRAEDPDYFETRWEWNADSLCVREIRHDGGSTEINHQRAQDHNSSRSNKTASRRHDGDVRVVRERASSAVDTDGDGTPDTTELAWFYEYDPRFGSPAARGKKLYVGNLPFSADARKGWDGTIKGSGHIDSARIITDRDSGRSKGFGFVISSIDPRGNKTTSEYDSHGNCQKSIKQGHYAVSNFHIEVDGAYNSYGQLTAITNAADANGHRSVDTITYYDSGSQTGYPQSIAIDESGVHITTSLEYDPRGNATNIVDPRGNNMVFTYNNLDQCVQSQSSSYGGGAGLPPQRVTTQYVFDANDNLVRCDVDNRDETAALNSDNPQWSTWFEYDALDRLKDVVEEISEGGTASGQYATNRFVYDANDNLIEALSPLAVSGADAHNTVAFSYDERDLLFQEIAAPGSPVQCTTRHDYDSNGNVIRISEGLEEGASVTTLEYDGINSARGARKAQGVMGSKAKAWMVNNFEVHPVFGLKSEWVETVWNKQCVEKDTSVGLSAKGSIQGLRSEALAMRAKEDTNLRLSKITDPMGNVTTFHYDRNDNLKIARHFGEKTNDVVGSAGNSLLAETRFTYDSFDRCVQEVDLFFDILTGSPIGDGKMTTAFAFAPNGECTSVTDDNLHTTTGEYDTAGRLIVAVGPSGKAKIMAIRDALGNVRQPAGGTDISAPGQPPQIFTRTNVFDALNRMTSSTDNVGNLDEYFYDSRGNLVSHIDPRGNETFAVFDGLNRCVAITNFVGRERGITISTSHVEYDVNSQRIASTDSNGNTTHEAYDSRGRNVAVTSADGTSSSLVWSPRSNLLRQQDANGTVITNSYDLLGRCVSRIITPGPDVAPSTTFETFAYDGFSRCVAASNDGSHTTLTFDSAGHCVSSTRDGLTSSSTYDGVGNCLSRTYPGGRVVTYTYDELDQVASVSSGSGGLPPASLAQFTYDGPGRVGTIIRPNRVNTRVQWSGVVNSPNATGDFGWDRISRVTHAVIPGNVLVDQRTLKYDPSQNNVSRVRTQGPTIPGEAITLSYDPVDRLTNFVRVSGAPDDVIRHYVLDGNGNRQNVQDNGVSQFYTMDNTSPVPADFQVNQYTSTPFDSRQYDENGSLVLRATATGPTLYYYDYADRLVEVQAPDAVGTLTTIASYAYDAFGRRIRKTLNPGPAQTVIDYAHSTEDAIIEERVNGTLTRTYVLPEVGDEVLVAFNQAGQPQYYHYDDLGNTLALTDASGAVLERYKYDDYGQVTFLTSDGIPIGASSSAVGNELCWAGLRFDSETGLHTDSGGGNYDPQVGRWITSIGLPKITPKIAKESHGKFRMANNPWSGGSPQKMKKGTVKFFNEAKSFGRIVGGDRSRTVDQTASTRAQDHNSSRSNKTASTKAQDHNSSRSNKTASSIAPGGGGGGGDLTGRLIVPVAMDKELRF